ncbi:MAG TPA: hypothetical protein GXX75_04345 [Clostridiales bacterium]|nr:hypothetical protein [Clostridiales bacterium]
MGELYRLASPTSGFAAVQYVYKAQSVVFAFLHSQRFGDKQSPLRLRGLKEDHIYRLEGGRTYAGSTLMNRGITLPLEGDFSSCMLVFADEGACGSYFS